MGLSKFPSLIVHPRSEQQRSVMAPVFRSLRLTRARATVSEAGRDQYRVYRRLVIA